MPLTAESLYQAVAQGLAAMRSREWAAGITNGTVKVSVADVRVEHEVKMTEFTKWLDRPGGSPRDMIQRQKIRSILGKRSNLVAIDLISLSEGGEQNAAAEVSHVS